MFNIIKGCHQYFSLLCIAIFVIHHFFGVKNGSTLTCIQPVMHAILQESRF
jgi:hypothetical protein